VETDVTYNARKTVEPTSIISGGQTGADIGGLKSAKTCGIQTGGWMPKGWKTEEGPHPEYAQLYKMREHPTGYAGRTRTNVQTSQATIWFGDPNSPGGILTLETCYKRYRPYIIIPFHLGMHSRYTEAGTEVLSFLTRYLPPVLNIAGNRESTNPGIEQFVRATLVHTITVIRHSYQPHPS